MNQKTLLFFVAAVAFLLILLPTAHAAYTETYYVSAFGNDLNDGLTELTPFETLAKTAGVINSAGTDGDYLVIVMTDLTSTACARYYDNSVTITSPGATPVTVTRGIGFSTLNEPNRGQYNPAMLEIGGDVSPSGPQISLTLKNIIFDDDFLHEGTTFDHQKKGLGNSWATDNLIYVQDAIVASYSPNAKIILGDGAQLHNFGGMTALRATDGATAIMESGSLITESSTTATRQLSSTATDYRAVGEAAVTIAYGAHFYMYEGAKIENIANAHSIKFDQSGFSFKCFIDGEITGMKGNKGWDATDHSSNIQHEGRGFKSAIYFNRGTTLDPWTGAVGPAIIGENANIHHNAIKCGAIGISRSTAISVKIYGKINDNSGQTGTRWQTLPIFGTVAIPYGTNGGGIYIVNGGTVYLEEGSELCRNSVIDNAYGGGANVQQSGSKLVMNGGLVSGNTASGMGPGIAVNKGGSVFEMNGGTVNNGANGVLLFNNAVLGQTDSDCNSYLDLKEGSVSGVTVHNNVAFGNNMTNQYRHLRLSEDVIIGTGHISVAGRNVALTTADLKIGNPNTATYTTIQSNLPQGWTMPTTVGNVIGFWIQKDDTVIFSVPAPTSGTFPSNYNRTLGIYFAAVQATHANGTADTSMPAKIHPTKIVGSSIVVSVPLEDYPNGATIALVQPTTIYGEIVFDAPALLAYDINAADYTIPYTATYDMPQGLHQELDTDGHDNTNTDFVLTIYPDSRTIPDVSNMALVSDLFEMDGTPVWNSAMGEIVVTLKLKSDWKNTANSLESVFEFDCDMDAADYEDGEFLYLTGELIISGNGKNYYVFGNPAQTEMKIPKYTVTYDPNGGTGTAPTETDKEEGETFTVASASGLTAPIATQQFKEWNTASDGTGTSYAEGETVTMPANNLIFYAIWVNSYIITYDANGGSGTMPSDTVAEGSNYIIEANTFTHTNYTFAGWNTAADGSGTAYAAGATITNVQSDITLYAQWKSGNTGGGGHGGGTIVPPVTPPSVPEGEIEAPEKESNNTIDNNTPGLVPSTPVKEWMLPLLII